jgi:peptidyl-prolyl cis-trans isomerase D
MITSLQNFFLKHNKWLFGGLLVVIIVTFVLTIGPQSFFGSGSGMQRKALQYYGYDLSSESDQRAMAFTAEISAILHPELQLRREQIMDYAYLRVAALGIASQLGIPQPTTSELSEYVETLMIFADRQTGEFSAETYNQMMEALQSNARFDKQSIGMVLREDYRIKQVRDALSGPGYALPFEIRQDYLDRETSYTVSLANFPYDSFNPEISATDEELLQFFNENPSRYEIEETLSVTALLFKAANFLTEVPASTEEDLQAWFATNKARYEANREQPAPVEGEETPPELPELALDDVREQVVAEWQSSQAGRIAAKKSEQFSLKLWQDSVALDSPEFDSMLQEYKVQTRDLPPYSRQQSPAQADVPAQLLNSMWIFASNPNRYFSDIAQIRDGAVILVKRGLTEARMPAFEEVREAVATDYELSEKRRLFAEKGRELTETLAGRLESESFADAAAALGLAVEDLEPFTGSAVPQQLRSSALWEQAQFLPQGSVSPMVILEDKGILACIREKSVPEIDTLSEDYKAFVEQRTDGFSDAMGWARLREITDTSLNALMGPPVAQE